MLYIAFQNSAFQSGAFQTFFTPVAQAQPGGGHKDKYIGQSYELSKHAYEIERLRKLEAERKEAETALKANEYRIRDLEERRLRALADKVMQEELMALFLEAQKLEAEKLRLEALIMFYIREEDDILAILYSMPFVA